MRRYEPTDISAEQTELATRLRVPFTTSTYPDWSYLTAVAVGPHAAFFDLPGLLPTEDEVRQIASWLTEYKKYYNQRYLGEMMNKGPFDMDGSANLGYLLKHEEGCWHYRKRTWSGTPLWPLPYREHEPWTLDALLAKIFDGWASVKKYEKHVATRIE